MGKGIKIFSWLVTVLQILFLIAALPMLRVDVPAGAPQDNLFGPEPSATHSAVNPTDAVETTEAPVVTIPAPTDPRLSFSPAMTDNSNPELFQLTWEIAVGDEIVESFTREDPICFELDKEYFALPGIATFRGNNYRNNASYGTAVIERETMGVAWSHRIGYLNGWGGCAWTGQPLVVQWDDETKAIMETMYDSKKNKEGLVEVIYATLDGYIHFYDLDDGSKTRDAIYMGMNFKGAGALDPRGYPLLYVGSGLYINGAAHRMFVVNLITGKIIYEHGNNDP
jgi:hypothetical protein